MKKTLEEAIEDEKELFLAIARKTVYNSISNGNVKVALEVLSRRDLRYKVQAKWTPDDPIVTQSVVQYQIPDNKRDDTTKTDNNTG